MSYPSPIEVSPTELRAIFNQQYHDRIARGDLTPRIKKAGHPAPERSGEPFCTQSQAVEYFNNAGGDGGPRSPLPTAGRDDRGQRQGGPEVAGA